MNMECADALVGVILNVVDIYSNVIPDEILLVW